MKIIFIDVIDENDEMQSKYYSLGIGYLVSSLPGHIKKHLNIKYLTSNIEEEIKSFKPRIVALSCVSQNYNIAKKIAKFCKENNIIVIIGKSHISALPECLDKNMDVGVIGEGEETFKELIDLYINNRATKENLNKVRGIVYHSDGKVVATESRPFIKDINVIPFPDREILNIKEGDNIYMFTSRGCPYRCRFCFSSRFWDTVRFFSAEYVINEIRFLFSKYNPLRINLYDDLFIADVNRLREIVKLIKKEDFYKKVKFTVSVRANLVNEETAFLMKEMGVDIVNMGLESGNERVLNYLKGSSVTVKQGNNAINILRKHKLQASASFIIGSPDETREEILDTLNFIKKSKLDLFEINVLQPLPGTPIWDHALGRGLVSDDMDWDKLNVNFAENQDESIILSEKLNRNEIKELFDLFQKERKKRHLMLLLKYIYRRPKEIIYFIKNKIKK